MQDKHLRYDILSDSYKLYLFRGMCWEVDNAGKSVIDGT